MQLAILLLLVIALGFLVLGLIGSSTPLIIASIVTSVVAVLVIVRTRRQQAERAPAATSAAGAEATAGPPLPTQPASGPGPAPAAAEEPASDGTSGEQEPVATPLTVAELAKRAEAPAASPSGPVAAAAEPEPATDDTALQPATADTVPEPAMADTEAPLRHHGDDLVWVVDGRPRYHVQGCAFLDGRAAEPVPLSQAVEDGFTPCADCDPDTSLSSPRRPQPTE